MMLAGADIELWIQGWKEYGKMEKTMGLVASIKPRQPTYKY
jgi:hypothetical protein